MTYLSRAVAVLLAVALLLLLVCPNAEAQSTPVGSDAMAAASKVLDEANVEAKQDCSHPSDLLVRILCRGTVRVGLRTYYPGFSVRNERGEFSGFEVDIARRIAEFLDVRLVTVAVDPKTRIPLVANGEIDLAIATMGHNTQRDTQVRFIRPHYFLSRTVVVGTKSIEVKNWDDLSGRTACLPVGASSNILFIRHHIPILTFDKPEQLLDALKFNECAFIVHDDTFFGTLLTDPQWTAKFAVKFGFAPIPWGMAVARSGTEQFSTLLTDLSIAFHADGVFLQLAENNRLEPSFLEAEQHRWSSVACVSGKEKPEPVCLIPPADSSDTSAATTFAPNLAWLQQSLFGWAAIDVGFTLLKDQSSFRLLMSGIDFSLALIIGSQVATMVFALTFGRLLGLGPPLLRRPWALLTSVGQTTPLPLLLFFGYVVAGGLVQYTGKVALVVSILVIGFYNGCNAGRAINEAWQALLRRCEPSGNTPQGRKPSFWNATSLAGIQLIAFLINAAKGSPAAGMIGVPEFLNVITDLTSYSSDRFAVYLILLVFYTGLVLLVITLLYSAQKRLNARRGRTA